MTVAKDLDLSPFRAAMKQRGRPASDAIKLPGCAATVRLWVPSASEREEADAEARKHLTASLKLDALQLSLAVDSELHQRAFELELLARVLRDPSDPSQAFCESVDELRDPDQGFTDEDRKYLMAALRDFESSRYEPALPDEDAKVVELIRDLKAVGGLSDFVERCSVDTLRSIVRSLAGRSPMPTSPSSSAT